MNPCIGPFSWLVTILFTFYRPLSSAQIKATHKQQVEKHWCKEVNPTNLIIGMNFIGKLRLNINKIEPRNTELKK